MPSDPSASSGEGYRGDEWPTVGQRPWDGRHLLALVNDGKSPFEGKFDAGLLLQEVGVALQNVDVEGPVLDVPKVSCGANNYVGILSFPLHKTLFFDVK